MAIKITDECINCGACEPECPNHAIYEGGTNWNFSEGTKLKGIFNNKYGESIDADLNRKYLANEFYYIVTDKCTECVGFHDEPQCAAVCPVDCCIPDENNIESKEQLLSKKMLLHC